MATFQIQPIEQQTYISQTYVQPAWFAIHTASRREKQVASQLAARQLQYFLPLYEESHRWADRTTRVQLPLFPGYLFVRIPLVDRMEVLRVPGVANLVGFGGTPVAVDDAELEALQRGVTSGMRIQPHPYLQVGVKARIRRGPFRGLEGVLQRVEDTFRVVISVALLMRSVAVEIDSADLQILS